MVKIMKKTLFAVLAIFTALPLSGLCGSFSRVSCNVASLPPERQFVAELLSSRVEARTPPSDCAQTLHVCFVLDASIPGENAAIMVKGNDATICAGRFVGLVQGAGALLRRIRYGRSTFTLDDGAYAFAPKKELRMAYFARHFHNWYHYATAEELTSYIDDLVLAGHNAFNFQYAYPTADRAGDTEEEKRRFADVSEKALARVHALDCGFCASGGSNQAPLDSPEELRGVPNSDRKRGNLGFNVCPAKPGGMDYLCDYRKRQLKELDGGRMDYFIYWPFDEGGCECDQCRPWGGKGFLELIERYEALNKAAHPAAKSIVSTWVFHDDDWAGLYKWLETYDGVKYILADSHTDFPKYPLEHPVPRNIPVITFPEISMWGRAPWGAYGATAMPKRFERLFRQAERISGGFMCYSEGLYEDINKEVVSGLYIDPAAKVDDLLRDYASYYLPGTDPEDFVQVCDIFETNHRFPGNHSHPRFGDVPSDSAELAAYRQRASDARRIAARMDGKLFPQFRQSWRWRLIYLRAMIDYEILAAREAAPESARLYFDELVKIYHAERQLADWRKTGKAGYTTPQYPAPAAVATPLAGRADTEDPRTRTYVEPVRIVWQTSKAGGYGERFSVRDADRLLGKHHGQVPEGGFGKPALGCVLVNSGETPGILLDFGRELHGGVQLGIGRGPRGMRVRLRFGESVAEAMSEIGEKGATNDHAMRDDVIGVPSFGTREIGNTGFRFLRIDLVTTGSVTLEFVRAVELMRPMARLGAFKCSDERLNRIWETALRTVHLCCQDYLWDGIKRDRLVWMGDTHPETMAILNVFGAQSILPESLDFMAATTKPDEWMNGIGPYTFWWIRNLAEWYRFCGDKAYLEKHRDYLKATFANIEKYMTPSNTLEGIRRPFLDWPTEHNRQAVYAGVQALALITSREGAFLAEVLADDDLSQRCRRMVARLETLRGKLDPNGSKQAAALLALSGLSDPKEMFAQTLGRNGVHGLSTFYGYYMLEAMCKAGEKQFALDSVRDYWGAMLDVGATSFWEDFNIDWTNNCFRIDELPVAGKKDIHADYGEFCYPGFRHSFCHGWSCGPVQWCVNNILGIRPIEVACRRVEVKPFLGDLDWAEGAMALPDGRNVSVRVERDPQNGLRVKVNAPEDVQVVRPATP